MSASSVPVNTPVSLVVRLPASSTTSTLVSPAGGAVDGGRVSGFCALGLGLTCAVELSLRVRGTLPAWRPRAHGLQPHHASSCSAVTAQSPPGHTASQPPS